MLHSPWTPGEESQLRFTAMQGQDLATMAENHSRTEGAIQSRLRRLGIMDRGDRILSKLEQVWVVDRSDPDSLMGLEGFLQRFLPDRLELSWTEAGGLKLEIVDLEIDAMEAEEAPSEFDAEPEARWEFLEPLRKLRLALAKQRGVPAYCIAWNCHLEEICLRMPRTLDELGRVRGIRKSLVQSHGSEILRVLGVEVGSDPQQGGADLAVGESLDPVLAEFVPSPENQGLVESVPAGIFLWEYRHPRAEITDHWKSFAALWMKLLEAEVSPRSVSERRVLDFLPTWERGEAVGFDCLWEEALLRYCQRIHHQRSNAGAGSGFGRRFP